jgi:hypothetical protein
MKEATDEMGMKSFHLQCDRANYTNAEIYMKSEQLHFLTSSWTRIALMIV